MLCFIGEGTINIFSVNNSYRLSSGFRDSLIIEFNSCLHKKPPLNLESPLLGGGFRGGQQVIREIFTEISRPVIHPNPSQEGIVESPPKRGIIHATL